MPLRVLLASDHPGLRESVRSLLESRPCLDVVASPATAEECLRVAAACLLDVAVVDATPGTGADHLVAALHRLCPEMAIIVLAMQADPSHVRAALDAGARGYLLRETAAGELGAALRAVSAGGAYIGARVQ